MTRNCKLVANQEQSPYFPSMVDSNVILGKDVKIFDPNLVNLFGCEIGDNSFIGPFVEVTRGVKIGKYCKIESHSFICDGTTLEDHVFIGHGVMFTNDLFPRVDRMVVYRKTLVKNYASLGSNCTIMGGISIGEHAVVVRVVPAARVIAMPA
jgi:acetyltransferase-like isoleucine patch superfamily enzyme